MADKVHNNYITFDTHNDSALYINNPNGRFDPKRQQVTFPKMIEGGLDGAVFAIYIRQGLRDSASSINAVNYVKDQLTKFKVFVKNQNTAAIVSSVKEIKQNKRSGKRSVMLGIENGYGIGKDLQNLIMFKEQNIRVMTLCHSLNNDICDSSTDTIQEFSGLSKYGEQVVKKMNELGIIIDVSHASKESVLDILKISTKPLIASHSGVIAIHNSPRNLSDEEIIGIASKGGVIQVVSLRSYLSSKPKEEVSIKDMADHIDYVKNLVGIKHVGIGTDFDGGGGVIGMEDVSKMKELTKELIRRGYSNRELKLFWGANFLRVLKAQNQK